MAKNINSKNGRPLGITTKIRLKKLITPARLQAALLKIESVPIFNRRDILRVLNLTPRQTKRAIKDAIEEGVLMHIKPGLFSLAVKNPSAFVTANYLVDPSYVSLESALSYYRIIPENVYTITSITPKAPKRFVKFNREFTYHKMNRNLFFGYRKVNIGGAPVLMAEKEKALLDFMYFIVRGLRKVNQRMVISGLDEKRLAWYADLFRKSLKERKLVAFNNLLKKLGIL